MGESSCLELEWDLLLHIVATVDTEFLVLAGVPAWPTGHGVDEPQHAEVSHIFLSTSTA